jgi:HEAT repeat protein
VGLFGSKPDIEGLRMAGDIKGLAQALGNRDPATRERIAEILGELRDGRAVPVLARLLGDRDEIVRSKAIEALSTIGGHEAEKALTRAMSDEFIGNRERAREAIARLIRQQDQGKVFGLDASDKEKVSPFADPSVFELREKQR